MSSWNVKYIGPHFTKRFAQFGIKSFKDLVAVVKRKSKSENTRLFERILANPRRDYCVMSNREGTGSYYVRQINAYAWHNLIKRLRQAIPTKINGKTNKARKNIPMQKKLTEGMERPCIIRERGSQEEPIYIVDI
jgi:hypothetical protein